MNVYLLSVAVVVFDFGVGARLVLVHEYGSMMLFLMMFFVLILGTLSILWLYFVPNLVFDLNLIQ